MIGVEEIAVPVLNGLSTGLALALVAAGLTLVFGVMHVINLAHAEFYMVGAYLLLILLGYIGNYWLALLVAAILVSIISLPIERLTLAPLRDRDEVQTLLVTFALMLISHQAAFEIFGGSVRQLSLPVSGSVRLGTTSYPMRRLVIIVAAVVILVLVWQFLERTRYGLMIRASSQDIENARSLGIPTNRVYSATFALGAFLAAISAGFIAPLRGVYPTAGLDLLIDIFIITIIGGLGSILGAVIAALLISFARAFSVIWLPSWIAQLVVFALVIVVVLVKPEGIIPKGQ